MASISHLLAELGSITRRAGDLAQEARKNLVRELKPDGSIVTNGDRGVEEFLRPLLTDLVPGSTVWGEEFGYEPDGGHGWWLVDPVDGTTNYAFGGPYWGVSIALVLEDRVQFAAIHLPDLRELYLAEANKGAYMNDTLLTPIPAGPVRPEEIVVYPERLLRKISAVGLPGRMRISGAFVVDGTFTANQRFRGMVGLSERLYDVAASVLINQEVGAEIRYTSGDAFLISDLKAETKIDRTWMMFPKDSGFFF
jgi:myo-inositol-1(or 4)-monophosphatase